MVQISISWIWGGPITTLIPLVHWNCIPKDKNDIQLLRIIQWDQIPEVQFQLAICSILSYLSYNHFMGI